MIVFARLVNWEQTCADDMVRFIQFVKKCEPCVSTYEHLRCASTGAKVALPDFYYILCTLAHTASHQVQRLCYSIPFASWREALVDKQEPHFSHNYGFLHAH